MATTSFLRTLRCGQPHWRQAAHCPRSHAAPCGRSVAPWPSPRPHSHRLGQAWRLERGRASTGSGSALWAPSAWSGGSPFPWVALFGEQLVTPWTVLSPNGQHLENELLLPPKLQCSPSQDPPESSREGAQLEASQGLGGACGPAGADAPPPVTGAGAQ